MHSEKNAPVRSDCHIANWLGVAQDFLKDVFVKQRFRRQVVVMFAAPLTYPHEQYGQATNDQQNKQEIPHCLMRLPRPRDKLDSTTRVVFRPIVRERWPRQLLR